MPWYFGEKFKLGLILLNWVSDNPPQPPPPHKLIAQLISEEIKERSRRFSQLPPASEDSPDAVKMGSKFTMIPTDAKR